MIVNSGNVSNSSCTPCSPSCKACTGSQPTQCTSCPIDSYLFGSECLSSTSCVALGAYYADSNNQRCLKCHPLCAVCTGATIGACSVCIDGYYFNSTSLKCEKCDSSCKTCATSPTTCLSCKISTYLNGTSCSSSASNCPKKTFADLTHSKCTACSVSNLDIPIHIRRAFIYK